MEYVKAAVLALLATSLIGGVAAQQQQRLQCPSDLVGPGLGPLWAADKAIDSVTKNFGQIAAERAAEACQAVKNNNINNARQAIQAHNRIAQRATTKNTKGLNKAEQVLQAVQEKVPEQAANTGITNALNAVKKAQNRQPEELPSKGPSGNQPGNNPGNPSSSQSPSR